MRDLASVHSDKYWAEVRRNNLIPYAKELLEKYDTDKDGSLSKEEFKEHTDLVIKNLHF